MLFSDIYNICGGGGCGCGCLRLVPLCVLLPLIGGVVKTASMLSAVAELELDVIGKRVLLLLLLLLPSPSSTDNVTSMCV
jgi:hypothetical protein